MDQVKPLDTSTPASRVRGRRCLVDQREAKNLQSPILKPTESENVNELIEEDEEFYSYTRKSDSDELSDNDECLIDEKSSTSNRYSRSVDRYNSKNKYSNVHHSNISFDKKSTLFRVTQLSVTSIIVMLIIGLYSIYNSESAKPEFNFSIENLTQNFPSQSQDTWVTIESSIEEILHFNKPSVIIFAYNNNADSTISSLLFNISMYASCKLNTCNKNPIYLTPKYLNKVKYIEDYGRVIHDFKPQLEETNVMIVENIDDVEGTVAQAFHSLCDEFTPLVAKSLFIFTIKTELINAVNLSDGINKLLHTKWSNIEIDKIEPLLARITSMIVRVVPDNR